ncbi:MAG: hypothetical protein IJ623_08190 [Bacteroidales bacterium]|nr:hypothetical protein [Bacteroidales bacterium]
MKIDTLNNNGVINDFSLHQEVSMPMRMPYPESWQKECEKEHGKKAAHKPVKLNAGAGRKLDFLRVMVALHEAGFFTDEVGVQIDRKDVFAAFGEILDLDLDRANANLSEGLNHYNQEMRAEIFDVLKKVYVEYENEVLERRKYR